MPDAQNPLSRISTGEHSFEGTKTVVYPFQNYSEKVLTTLDGKFIGISEISLRKEFLDHPAEASERHQSRRGRVL